jgi:hypothetical protein
LGHRQAWPGCQTAGRVAQKRRVVAVARGLLKPGVHWGANAAGDIGRTLAAQGPRSRLCDCGTLLSMQGETA